MRKEHTALLDRMLEDELLNGDRALINELITEDPEFCEAYILYNDLHNNLAWMGQPTSSEVDLKPAAKLFPAWLLVLAGAAAVVLAGIAFEVSRRSAAPPKVAATVPQQQIELAAMTTSRLRIEKGEAEFVLDNGVRLRVAGPAQLNAENSQYLKLIGGRIDVEVPKGAEGFTVETDVVKIVDLGTAFSVSADSRQTVVSVRLGRVEVHAKNDERLLMHGGMSAVFREGQGLSRFPLRMEDADGLEQAFEIPVSTFTGVVAPAVKASGAVRWYDLKSTSAQALASERSTDILVIPEMQNLKLPYDLPVTCAAPGTYSEFDNPTRKIAAGTVVDVYRLRLHPEQKDRAMAAMTFPSIVRGVICTTELLAQTDALVGLETVRTRGRGLESRSLDANNDDAVTIGDNRRTLTVVMQATVYDEIRILVESQSNH